MILKRVLPVIAAIAVLCCMMIVPASAASVSEFVSVGVRSFGDLDVYLQFDNSDGESYSLSVSHPERVLEDMSSWESSGGSIGGTTYYQQYSYNNLVTESMIVLDSQWNIYAVDFEFDDFVVPLNRSIFATLFSINCFVNDTVDFSFDISFVNSNGDVERSFCEFDFSSLTSDYSNPFVACNVYDYLLSLGAKPGSFVIVSNFVLTLYRSKDVDRVSYRVYCPSEDYDAIDFLHYNGIDYGDFIYESVDGSSILQGFSGFLTDGVGAFLATPTFGEFSIGDLLAGVVAVLFALVIIKMFAH